MKLVTVQSSNAAHLYCVIMWTIALHMHKSNVALHKSTAVLNEMYFLSIGYINAAAKRQIVRRPRNGDLKWQDGGRGCRLHWIIHLIIIYLIL